MKKEKNTTKRRNGEEGGMEKREEWKKGVMKKGWNEERDE